MAKGNTRSVYVYDEHLEWYDSLPTREKSKIANEAFKLYRETVK